MKVNLSRVEGVSWQKASIAAFSYKSKLMMKLMMVAERIQKSTETNYSQMHPI